MGRRNNIPDRWLNYSSVGDKIAGTSFIAFKVPLHEKFVNHLPDDDRFTTQVLMERVPDLGLIIDLTNTDRYYNSKDILGQGIRYEKIFCRGHEIPNRSVVDRFFSIIDEYMKILKTSADEKLIGVHCTHGLNRTGYLLCRYMIKRLGFNPEDAIAAFEKARGYRIERELYIKDLSENEGCADPQISDMNQTNHSTLECSKDSAEVSSRETRPGSFQKSPRNTWIVDSPRHMQWDTGFSPDYRSSSLFSRYERNDRSYSDYSRANGFLPQYDNDRMGRVPCISESRRFNGFRDSSRPYPSARASADPYHWKPTSSHQSERPYYSNRVFSRFHEKNYDHYQAASPRYSYPAATFTGDFRKSSGWQQRPWSRNFS